MAAPRRDFAVTLLDGRRVVGYHDDAGEGSAWHRSRSARVRLVEVGRGGRAAGAMCVGLSLVGAGQRALSGPAVTVSGLVTIKQRTILVALRDAQHANDAQPVDSVAVARWCPEPWTCRVQLVVAALLALQAQGLAACVSELGGRTWRLTEAGRRQLVPRRGPAPANDRRITAR